MFEALELTIKKNCVDASLPQTIVPLPQTGGGAGVRAGAVAPAPEQRKPRRVVRHPPEVDFKGLIVGYLLSIDKKLGEELQSVSNPSETLRLSLSLLSQDDW